MAGKKSVVNSKISVVKNDSEKDKKKIKFTTGFSAWQDSTPPKKNDNGDDFGRFLRAGENSETQKVLSFSRKMAIPL